MPNRPPREKSCRVHCVPAVRIALCTLAAAVSPLHGQGTDRASEPLRLGSLYEQVARANPKIAAARQLARAAEARVPVASRPPDPQLQLGVMNYSLPRLVPMETVGMTQLQVMQMLPLGGKLRLGRRIAAARATAAGERARDMEWAQRALAAMVFYDLYAADRQLDVARGTLRLLEDVARSTQAMYRVGGGRQVDVLRAQVEVARMTEDTLRMLAMRQTMVARLNAILDRDAGERLGAPVMPHFPDSVPERAWLDSVGSASRPMVLAAMAEVGAAEAESHLAARELLPDLQLGVQYAQRRVAMAGIGADGMTTSDRVTERMGSLMIGATIPVFARDRQLQMRSEAVAMQAMAGADLAAMRAETRGRIGEAYAGLARARTLAALYRVSILPQAEAAATSAMSGYRAGVVDFMTLLDNRMTVNSYRQQLATLQADEGKAWAELEMLAGRALFDAGATRAGGGR